MRTFLDKFNRIEFINFFYVIFLLLLSFLILLLDRNPFIIEAIMLYNLLIIGIIYLVLNKERFKKSKYKSVSYIFRTNLYNLIYLIIYVPLVFNSLKYIVPYIFTPKDFYLAKIDSFLLFNFNPFLYFQYNLNKIAILNIILQIVYIIYFFLPLIIVIYHFLNRDKNKILDDIFFIILGLYISYIGYILVPAYGPRFYYNFSEPLYGNTIFTFLNDMLNQMEHNKLDAFPSAHIEMTLVALYLVRKDKKLFRLFIIEFIGIILATILLRYHYIIDIIAGVLFYFITIKAGKYLSSKLKV